MTGRRRSGVGGALALLALAFPLWEWGSCWGLTHGPGELDKSPRSDPGPWGAPHRHRRSWVWNQFFVLEEYTGNEPLYVGKVSETRPLTGSALTRTTHAGDLPRTHGCAEYICPFRATLWEAPPPRRPLAGLA